MNTRRIALAVCGLTVGHARKARARALVDDLSFEVAEGEMLAFVGESGSGKSLTAAAIFGLLPFGLRRLAGSVHLRDTELTALSERALRVRRGRDMGLVFQNPLTALNPSRSVQAQIAETYQVHKGGTRGAAWARARSLLAEVGLASVANGPETYPHQLSGGMRQRVGFARALVVHPNILLMDEPFSALDVLTAETLRTDFLELWSQGELPIGSVLLVTHNIEEAVQMCDRLLIFSTHPGRVVSEIPVDLPQPRGALDPAVRALVDRVYVEMTARPRIARAGQRAEPVAAVARIDMPLEHVSTNLLSGLIEAVSAPPYEGRADLPAIAQALHMEADDLFPVAEALQTLRLAEVEGGDIRLTDAGLAFARSETDERKNLFAHQLLAHVPLAAHVRHVLDERSAHLAPKSRFLDELEDYMTEQSAEQTLRALISWGRYAEIFAYDDQRQLFSLENPA